ncbi:MAG: ferritin-like domain-containing protein [Aquisalimonadaceae bacterium]
MSANPDNFERKSLYAADRPERGLHALKLSEKRFPLSTERNNEKLAKMWHQSKHLTWDAVTDIPYEKFDKKKYSEEQLRAGRLCWSRRTWTEYTGIVESPSLCIRLCLEGNQSIQTKFMLAAKGFEEARHAEASFLLAEAMGGYVPEPPPGDAIQKMIIAGFRDAMAFNPEVSVESGIAAWHCVSEGIALDTFLGRYKVTSEPVTKEVIRLIAQDETRHVEMGWAYLEQRTKELSKSHLAEIEATVRDVIENVELKGFHSTFMLTDSETSELREAEAIAATAGLGFCSPEQEHKIFVQYIQNIRRRFGAMGIRIPAYPEIEE